MVLCPATSQPYGSQRALRVGGALDQHYLSLVCRRLPRTHSPTHLPGRGMGEPRSKMDDHKKMFSKMSEDELEVQYYNDNHNSIIYADMTMSLFSLYT